MKRFLKNYARLGWVSATLIAITWESHCIYAFRLIGPIEMVDIVRGYDPGLRVWIALMLQVVLAIVAAVITIDQIDVERRKAK